MPVRTKPKAPVHGRETVSGWSMNPRSFPSKPERSPKKKFDPATTVRIIAVHCGGLTKKGELNLSARLGLWMAIQIAARFHRQRIQYQYLFTPGRLPAQQFRFQRPCDLMARQVALLDRDNGNEIIVPNREIDLTGKPDRYDAIQFANTAADRRNARLVTVPL